MVENYQTVDFYLERAADYEQKAERPLIRPHGKAFWRQPLNGGWRPLSTNL
jgi:hypothetical protein